MSKKEPVTPAVVSLKKILEHPENLEVLDQAIDNRVPEVSLKKLLEESGGATTLVHFLDGYAMNRHLVRAGDKVGDASHAEHADDADYAPVWPAIAYCVAVCVVIIGVASLLLMQKVDQKVIAALKAAAPAAATWPTATTSTAGTEDSTSSTTPPEIARNIVGKMISLKVTQPCWIRVHQLGGNWDWVSRTYSADDPPPAVSIDDGKTAQVRSGCPGAIKYFVNGKEVHPATKSQSDRIELVTLP